MIQISDIKTPQYETLKQIGLTIKFALLIPCFNPSKGWEKNFLSEINSLNDILGPEFKGQWQIFLINDGSSQNFDDYERSYLRNCTVPLNIIENTANVGKGYSIRKVANFARAEVYVFTDLDFPFGVQIVKQMIDKVQNGSDIVIGSRSKKEYYDRASFSRRIISKSLMFLNRFIIRLPFEDSQTGIKAFNQKGKILMLKTSINRFLFDLEFLVLASAEQSVIISNIEVRNSSSLRLSTFTLKTMMTESFNFLSIFIKYKNAKRKKYINRN